MEETGSQRPEAHQARAIASAMASLVEFLPPQRQQLPDPCTLERRPKGFVPSKQRRDRFVAPTFICPLFREQNLAHPASPDADVRGQGPAVISLGRP